MFTSYTSEDNRVWRYCSNNDFKIKVTLNIVTSQTETRVASTTSRESYNYYNSKYMKSKR